MLYPKLKGRKIYRSTLKSFYGYDRRLKPPEGAFTNTQNLSLDAFPLLSNRKKRAVLETLSSPGGISARDALAVIDGGRLFYNGLPTPLEGMTEGEKQLVSMGAYICIFPDKLYYNTQNGADWGSMEACWDYSGQVEYSMCSSTGEDYENVIFSRIEPASPQDGAYWSDTTEGTLKRYSGSENMWVKIDSVYTKLRFTTQGQLPGLFSCYDGVEIQGARFASLNGTKIICALGGQAGEDAERDYIVLSGEPAENYVQAQAQLSIRRTVPDMDFVCQCQNRLWGCFYGNNGRENLNELYACALGDFKNWHQYMGLSTDSWRASVGSDGVWTGAVNYLGSPVFFKEERLHTVGVSATGAHQISERVCRGVQKGSHKSLAVIDETLFYKSACEVCAYQGGFPQGISAALGEPRYYQATGCGFGKKYYISMRDAQMQWHLFVYDSEKGLWIREDGLRADFMAQMDDELYCISGSSLYALQGTVGEKEKTVAWMAESGLLCCSEPDKKYISRLSLRAAMDSGSEMDVYIEYDSSGIWESAGRLRLASTGTVELPLHLRRCDHIRLKLSGRGDIKLLSLSREECRN